MLKYGVQLCFSLIFFVSWFRMLLCFGFGCSNVAITKLMCKYTAMPSPGCETVMADWYNRRRRRLSTSFLRSFRCPSILFIFSTPFSVSKVKKVVSEYQINIPCSKEIAITKGFGFERCFLIEIERFFDEALVVAFCISNKGRLTKGSSRWILNISRCGSYDLNSAKKTFVTSFIFILFCKNRLNPSHRKKYYRPHLDFNSRLQPNITLAIGKRNRLKCKNI